MKHDYMEKCNAYSKKLTQTQALTSFYRYEKCFLAVMYSLVWFLTNTCIHTFTGIDCIVNEPIVFFLCFIFPSYCSQEVRYQIIPPDLSPCQTPSSWALSEAQTLMTLERDDYPLLILDSLLVYKGIKMCT